MLQSKFACLWRSFGWLVVLVAQPSAAVGPSQDPTLWLDLEHLRPYVIPESSFADVEWSDPQGADLSALPLSDVEAASLRSLVAAGKGRPASEGCRTFPPGVGDSFGFGGKPGTKTLRELVQDADAALVGRVSRLVPMWNPVVRRPHTLVVLQLEEVVPGSDPGTFVGDELTYVLPYGVISFDDVEICLLPASGFVPAVGDRFLVLGTPDRFNSGNLLGVVHFRIRGDLIFPGDHQMLRDRSVQSWSALRASLTGAAGEQE